MYENTFSLVLSVCVHMRAALYPLIKMKKRRRRRKKSRPWCDLLHICSNWKCVPCHTRAILTSISTWGCPCCPTAEASDVTMAPANLPSWWCLWQKSCLKNSGNQYRSSWPITLTQQAFYYQMFCKHLPWLRPTITAMNKRRRPLKIGLNFWGRTNKPYNKWVLWRWPRCLQ